MDSKAVNDAILFDCMYAFIKYGDSKRRDKTAKFLLSNGFSKKDIAKTLQNNKSSLSLEGAIAHFNEEIGGGNTSEFVEYNECPILCSINRKKEPLITTVRTDEFTKMVENNFDYSFTGESRVYPYELPKLPKEFGICCIVGASGSGKSTLLKEFDTNKYRNSMKEFDDNAIVSNFDTPQSASERLSASGLNSMPVWCRPRRVLSVGEGFRADLALNIDSYTIFDEFTSTIDRNVAKSTCNGINKYIRKNGIHNVIFCSCHKDYIPFLKPDIVIDLDDEVVYDCRGKCLGKTLRYKSMKPTEKICGEFLGSIII